MANFQYPNAGQNAPAGVQQSIDQFRRLPVLQKKDLPLLYFLLGSGNGTPPYKMDPGDAAYTARSAVSGQECANCSRSYLHVKSGGYICDQISGFIQPKAWCRLWTP